MRPELELIEKIEKYLKGELSPAEKAEFEQQISANSELQKEVKLQQDIMNGLARVTIKQSIQKAYHAYVKGKNFLKWGSTGLGIAIVSTALIYFIAKQPAHNKFEQVLPALNEIGTKEWSDADKYLPAQKFTITSAKDTVIQTNGGIVMAIPANCFLDNNGKPVTGPIEFEVKEALDRATIIKSGLSSKSGDKLLESGGMFYVNARKNGQSLAIDPKNGIYTQVPTDSLKSDMQLFQGKRLPDGRIDWVNPKPIVHDLVPVDIYTLDFYPPRYLDSLAKWGYDIKNKKFTDSLYYSYATLFTASIDTMGVGVASLMPQRANGWNDANILIGYKGADTTFYVFPSCGINPAKIKAIWSDQFQNTLIATREFASRMPYIHQTGMDEILDMYINNLDKSLSYCDSLAAERLKELPLEQTFKSFAARGDGKVPVNSSIVTKLKEFYKVQAKLYTEAILKSQNEFWKKQQGADSAAKVKTEQHALKDEQRLASNFQQEFDSNLVDAYRQLGYPKPNFIPQKNCYKVVVTTTGWNNVDKYVLESTFTRSTLDYTDKQTGKKAVITYLPISVQVNNYSHYDQVFVYLLPDKLNSFMRLTDSSGIFKEKLDGIMTYSLACVAYKDDSTYFFSQTNVQAKDYKVTLKSINAADLKIKLNSMGNQGQQNDLADEASFIQLQMQEQKRQKIIRAINELYRKTGRVLFPCMYFPSEDIKQ